MTASHELSSEIRNIYTKRKWSTIDLKKMVEHVSKLLNDGSRRNVHLLVKSKCLKLAANNYIENFPCEVEEELQVRVLT